MTLTDFLLARIAEDERDARQRSQAGEGRGTPRVKPSPARVISECEAKRRIVAEHRDAYGPNLTTEWGQYMQGGLRHAVQILALPYADHPEYDEGWKP